MKLKTRIIKSLTEELFDSPVYHKAANWAIVLGLLSVFADALTTWIAFSYYPLCVSEANVWLAGALQTMSPANAIAPLMLQHAALVLCVWYSRLSAILRLFTIFILTFSNAFAAVNNIYVIIDIQAIERTSPGWCSLVIQDSNGETWEPL